MKFGIYTAIYTARGTNVYLVLQDTSINRLKGKFILLDKVIPRNKYLEYIIKDVKENKSGYLQNGENNAIKIKALSDNSILFINLLVNEMYRDEKEGIEFLKIINQNYEKEET